MDAPVGDPHICVWCGRPAGSNEHVWADWISRYVVSMLDPNDLGQIEKVKQHLDVTSPDVCHTCNTGWMRKLEQRVSPILKPMMVGEGTTLPSGSVRILRRWAIKTAIMFDCLYGGPIASPELRQAVHLGQNRGQAWVALARHSTQPGIAHYRTRLGHALTGDRHVAWVVLVLGWVLIVVLNDFYPADEPMEMTATGGHYFTELPRDASARIDWPDHPPVEATMFQQLVLGPNPDLRGGPGFEHFGR